MFEEDPLPPPAAEEEDLRLLRLDGADARVLPALLLPAAGAAAVELSACPSADSAGSCLLSAAAADALISGPSLLLSQPVRKKTHTLEERPKITYVRSED